MTRNDRGFAEGEVTSSKKQEWRNTSESEIESNTRTLKLLAKQTIDHVKKSVFTGRVVKEDQNLRALLFEIIKKRDLSAVFQPIVSVKASAIVGYEGLIRGPEASILASPIKLFEAAYACGLMLEIEHLCRQVVLESFVKLDLKGKLFLNISPRSLLDIAAKHGETLAHIKKIGFSPDRVIIELTETEPTYDYDMLRNAVLHYRNMGFEIAIDDLGQGFSSLRLWSELRPEYVKIDMYFVRSIDANPINRQFVQSIQAIAEKSGTQIIAEGIETSQEYSVIREIGIAFAQGYFIARPSHRPPAEVSSLQLTRVEEVSELSVSPLKFDGCVCIELADSLLKVVPVVSPDMNNNQVFDLFASNPKLSTIPVVSDDIPVGLINRSKMVESFAQQYSRELYGRRKCQHFMDQNPLVVDKNTSLQALSHMMVEAESHHLANGFIITNDGKYMGMGTGHDLMRKLTLMQISAARYANPLTQLPGSVPINEQIDNILAQERVFHVCYGDLDHFKPFNDVFGYQKGDEVIRLTSQVLIDECGSDHNFIGHIGGDDFIILFCSQDWELRCNRVVSAFSNLVLNHFSPNVREQGGYFSEDRQGKKIFQPLVSLSLGVTCVFPRQFVSHHQISEAAAEAKKQAKKIHGNSLFIERRGTIKTQ